jgi:hypothetical protein
MQNVIDLAIDVNVVGHVVLHEKKPFVPHQMSYIISGARDEIIQRDDLVPLIDKLIA